MSAPLDLDMLMKAYAIGVFPMADSRDADDVYWVEPKTRAIMPLDGFHLSKSLAKTLKRDVFQTTADAAFGDVLRMCAESTEGRPSTWINDQIAQAVLRLHAMGLAHSIETWLDGELVGGLYGVKLGRAFFGESMFSRKTDASKIAMAHLVARLRAGGFKLLDCQFQTPHLESLGAIEINKKDYAARLAEAVAPFPEPQSVSRPDFDALACGSSPRAMMVSGPISGWTIWHSLTQTS
jgi:leucyl/phenylalanyl-tRNA--protein transferase